jgi:uncharacterized protein (TIGR00251 family)
MTHNTIDNALQTQSVIEVIVKPNAKKTAIESYDEEQNRLIVSLQEPAYDNKANSALIRLLRKVSKRDIKIKHGTTGKRKLILLD